LAAEKIVDQIVPEPAGGAHADHDQAARFLDAALSERLAETVNWTQEERLAKRHDKLRQFGRWGTE
jgi:acetyl-CoA carboxylase alpha subunit